MVDEFIENNESYFIDVEQTFDEFVKAFGGEVVRDIMHKDPNLPKNADYLFRNQSVVAELKCLQKDLFNCEEDMQRRGELFQKWINEGVITENLISDWMSGKAELPEKCFLDIYNLAKRPIETAIRKAKKQIAITKEHFRITNAYGVLLIANDGNYFLESGMLIQMICELMTHRFKDSAIDAIIYFTPNMPANLPGYNYGMRNWGGLYKNPEDRILRNFVDILGDKYFDFYFRKTGLLPAPTLRLAPESAVKNLRNMKYYQDLRRLRR